MIHAANEHKKVTNTEYCFNMLKKMYLTEKAFGEKSQCNMNKHEPS